jgi:TetR/AcrR family fatty acid metabolism transcriptional regulator
MEKITHILSAARDLFAEKGFEQTPIAEIAKKAGVAGGTIIYHFKSKDNLLFILIRQILYSLYRQAQDEIAAATNGLNAVESYIRAFFGFLDSRGSDFKVLLKTNPFEVINLQEHPNADVKLIFERYLDLLVDAIKRGQADGSIRDGQPSEMGKFIFATLFGSAQLKVVFGDSATNLLDSALHFARAGLKK